MEGFARFRSVMFSLPYGDQGIFLPREVWESFGPYPDVPMMEDFELVRSIRTVVRGGLAQA